MTQVLRRDDWAFGLMADSIPAHCVEMYRDDLVRVGDLVGRFIAAIDVRPAGAGAVPSSTPAGEHPTHA